MVVCLFVVTVCFVGHVVVVDVVDGVVDVCVVVVVSLSKAIVTTIIIVFSP